MKSTRSLKSVRILLLAVLAAGLSASVASAQDTEGKFTLPFAARWEKATLPAGDYSFILEGTPDRPNSMLVVYRGTRAVALILNLGVSDAKTDRSELVLEGTAVRKLTLAEMGLTLEYPAPPRRTAPKEMELAQTIPVANSGPRH